MGHLGCKHGFSPPERPKGTIGRLLSVAPDIRRRSPEQAVAGLSFGGEGALDSSKANIPQEQWNALATVAAAHEIIAQ